MISRKWLAGLVSFVIVLTALLTGPVAYADEESVNFEDAMEKIADLGRARANGDVSPDRVIVIYDRPSSTNDPQRFRVRQIAGARLLSADRTLGRDVLRVPGGAAAAVAQVLRALPGVRDAYPDIVARVADPNDTLFPDPGMYGLKKIQAETAWATSTAASVKVAVLDCGIAAHEDLAGKVVLANDIAGSGSTDDRCNHGTHVAGTIAALTNNSLGVASVAHGAELLNGKVLGDNGSGSFADIDLGIKWAADNGAKVINLSLGADIACPTGTRDAVAYARSKGAVVVAAAGNGNASHAITPANCPFAVAVAATDQNDAKASFSNFGTNVDVAAPGVGILSTVNPALNGGNKYAAFSGTSMASPHAAGVAALLFATPHAAGNTATEIADAVVARLSSTTDPIAAGIATNGRVNAAKAVEPIVPGFSLSISPASQEVPTGGGTASYTVSLARTGGFDEVVALSVSGAPEGATLTFDPSALSGTAPTSASTLTVTTASGTSATFTLTVTGTATGGSAKSATATLKVVPPSNFTLSIGPPDTKTILRGGDPTYTVNILRTNFTGAVSFTITGLPPARASASFSPNNTTGNSSTLKITTGPRVARGNYALTVTGTSGGLTRTATATLIIN